MVNAATVILQPHNPALSRVRPHTAHRAPLGQGDAAHRHLHLPRWPHLPGALDGGGMSKRRPAPWVPLSVYYSDDAALMEAGEFAEVMFTRMMAYAGRQRCWNGRLPRSVVLSRLGLYALENVPESAPEVRLDKLLECGLVTAQGAQSRSRAG